MSTSLNEVKIYKVFVGLHHPDHQQLFFTQAKLLHQRPHLADSSQYALIFSQPLVDADYLSPGQFWTSLIALRYY